LTWRQQRGHVLSPAVSFQSFLIPKFPECDTCLLVFTVLA
jgi:hypothetical protein